MRNLLTTVLCNAAVFLSFCDASHGQDAFRDQDVFRHSPAYASAMADIYAKLKPIFQKYYPKVVMTNEEVNGLHFEYDVTTFDFSTPALAGSGAKRENPIQKGPKHGGILCSVHLEKGKYGGQRGLIFAPVEGGQFAEELIDRKEYKQLLLAPYSTKRDAYLWVSLSYPSDVSDEFLKEFRATIKSFTNDAH